MSALIMIVSPSTALAKAVLNSSFDDTVYSVAEAVTANKQTKADTISNAKNNFFFINTPFMHIRVYLRYYINTRVENCQVEQKKKKKKKKKKKN